MSRPPRARAKVFDAALKIVRTEGVRRLTMERLEQESGVSRGGINYHWRSRQALLHALLDHDIEAWQQHCRELTLGSDTDMVGHIRCALDPSHSAGNLLAHLAPEVHDDPGARARIEQFALRPCSDLRWDDADIARYILMLAAEGAFWRRVHGVTPQVAGLDARIRRRIEALLDP